MDVFLYDLNIDNGFVALELLLNVLGNSPRLLSFESGNTILVFIQSLHI